MLGHSGAAVVPPFRAHHVADGRDHQPDGLGLREHAHRVQYVLCARSAQTLPHSSRVIPSAWIFDLAGGAIGDFEDNCLPKEQRDAAWTVAALHQWDMGIDDPRCITSAEAVSLSGLFFSLCCFLCACIDVLVRWQWMKTTISPMATGGPFPVVSNTPRVFDGALRSL